MNAQDYIPVLVCAVLIYVVLKMNPTFLHGSNYGDTPANKPDALMTALLVAVVGAAVVYCMSGSMDDLDL